MMWTKIWRRVFFVLSFSAMIFSGALLISVKTAEFELVETTDLTTQPGVRVLSEDWDGITITELANQPGNFSVDWKETSINLSGTCRVDRLDRNNVRVLAQLPNGGQYPIVIDSGNPRYLLITDTIVAEAGLEIYPMQGLGANIGGFCHVCPLKIGNMEIVHPPCEYTITHYRMRSLGWTWWREKKLNMGLGLMKGFKYIIIDCAGGAVEFSSEQSFQADASQAWSQYPMTLETDQRGHEWLMVDIDLGSGLRHIILDTGAGSGLIAAKDAWAKLSQGLQIKDVVSDKLIMTYGLEPCENITLTELRIGDMLLCDAVVKVIDNNNPWGPDFALLGIGYFANTAIALDFEHSRLWIQK